MIQLLKRFAFWYAVIGAYLIIGLFLIGLGTILFIVYTDLIRPHLKVSLIILAVALWIGCAHWSGFWNMTLSELTQARDKDKV